MPSLRDPLDIFYRVAIIMAIIGLILIMAFFSGCSEQDKQDAIEAAPKQFELNIHLPIPVEPWPLPSE